MRSKEPLTPSPRRAGLCLLACVLLAAWLAPGGAAAPDAGHQASPAATAQIRMAPLRPESQQPPPGGGGCIPPAMDLSHLTGQRMPAGVSPRQLPADFDWRNKMGSNYVTPVKDQGNCGSCYAFGTLGNFESKMLIDGAGTYDFSENHAKECNWRELNDYQYPPGTPWGSCDGGNAFMLANLFSQRGTMLESCNPYVPSDVTCSTICPYQKTVLDWRLVSGNSVPSATVLKQYLYDHGPLITSMYVDTSEGFDNTYDGSFTFNYLSPTGWANHCVLIVGWSDDLPPVPDAKSPATGWIVKNSWGTGWGDQGYFYIEYGAANIGIYSSFFHQWQDYDDDGSLLYYDDDGWSSDWGYGNTTVWALAGFTPPADRQVQRVEFWTNDATTDVDVYLYDTFNGSTPGQLLASKLNNSFGEAGYHSVALDSPLPISAGNDVFAVLKITNATYIYPAAGDINGPHETGRTYLSSSGTSWTDMGAAFGVDVGIRLRTGEGSPDEYPIYVPLALHQWPPVTTTTLEAIADATVLQGYAGFVFGDTTDMWTGYDHCLEPEGQIARSLVQFDLSTLPPGATVTQATLYLQLINSCDIGERVHPVTVSRVAGEWEETTLMWHNQPGYAEAYGTTWIPSRTWDWYAFDVTGLVQGWLAGTFADYGLVIHGPESSSSDSARLGFATRETDYDPYLEVTYINATAVQVAPATGAPPAATPSGQTIGQRLGGSAGQGGYSDQEGWTPE